MVYIHVNCASLSFFKKNKYPIPVVSTLGLVEAIVFLAHHYYDDLNLRKERIFADIHFTLFFVAIINAFMSCIIYSLASRVATNRWVKLEVLDVNHYVATRRQFDQVQKQMKIVESDHKKSSGYNNGSSNRDKTNSVPTESFSVNPTERTKNNNNDNFVTFVGTVLDKPSNTFRFGQHDVLKGILKKKHAQLLVQLRFHELRVHFIETNQLKPNFR